MKLKSKLWKLRMISRTRICLRVSVFDSREVCDWCPSLNLSRLVSTISGSTQEIDHADILLIPALAINFTSTFNWHCP